MSRTIRMSLRILTQRETAYRGALSDLIYSSEDLLDSLNNLEIKEHIFALKDAHQKYRENNLALVDYHRHPENTGACKSDIAVLTEDRHQLYSEYRNVYGALSRRLSELGFTPASSVADQSEYSSRENVARWVNNSNPAHAGFDINSGAAANENFDRLSEGESQNLSRDIENVDLGATVVYNNAIGSNREFLDNDRSLGFTRVCPGGSIGAGNNNQIVVFPPPGMPNDERLSRASQPQPQNGCKADQPLIPVCEAPQSNSSNFDDSTYESAAASLCSSRGATIKNSSVPEHYNVAKNSQDSNFVKMWGIIIF